MRRAVPTLGAVLASLLSVLAAPHAASAEARRGIVVPAAPQPNAAATVISDIFLNRCEAGCMVKPGEDDAGTDTSALVVSPTLISSYPWGPGEWEKVVKCVQEVYSPYKVRITDTRPTGVYNEIIVSGGTPTDIGYDSPGALGVAQVSRDCSPRSNAVSWAFFKTLDAVAQQETNGDKIVEACWTIAQETAHSLGLDHEYAFEDGSSACNDPMTYRSDCGGQKFFRNAFASCGEFGPARPGCGPNNTCSTRQNSHQQLLRILGAGTPTTAKPMSEITVPQAGAMIGKAAPVHATASAQRGVARAELWLNGFKWAEAKGARFGASGQPPSDYSFVLPGNLPDGVIDIVVKAFDDLGIEGDSATVTVTKGAACTSAASCLAGQKCEQGKCFWDPPAGQLGDACTYQQYCLSGLCAGPAGEQICTTTCTVGIEGVCDVGYDCVPTTGADGVCQKVAADEGGCCSVGPTGPGELAAQGGLAAGLLALVLRRRRR